MVKQNRKTKKVDQEKSTFTDTVFIEYLSKLRTEEEILKKFKGLTVAELNVHLLEYSKNENFCLFKGENQNVKSYILIPKFYKHYSEKRIWKVVQSSCGQPTLGVVFPNVLDWEKIRVVFFGTINFGGECDEKMLNERLHWIAREPHVFAIFNGDCIAGDLPADDIESTIYRFAKKLAPIAHKILWMQRGCNEEKLMTKIGVDLLENRCKPDQLDIPYFSGGQVHAEIHWSGANPFTFFCLHGKSTAEKKGSKLNAGLVPFSWLEHTCFVVVSHMTDSMFKKVLRFKRNQVEVNIDSAKQFLVIAPALIKYFGGKLAKKGIGPASRDQINAALYKNGDYHVYAGSKAIDQEITFHEEVE